MTDEVEEAPVLVRHEGLLCRLILNHPARGNALGPKMVSALDAELTRAVEGGARLVVLQGAGRNLCTGFDLSGLEQMTDATLLERFIRVELLLQRIHGAAIVTMAVATGRTYGAGADLFAACDRRIAVKGARFAFPGSAFGLMLGIERLAARIGQSAARALLLDGGDIGAEEAVTLGLATALVPAHDVGALVPHALAAASRLDPATVATLHAATRPGTGDAELATLVRSASRPGLRERIMAYREATRVR